MFYSPVNSVCPSGKPREGQQGSLNKSSSEIAAIILHPGIFQVWGKQSLIAHEKNACEKSKLFSMTRKGGAGWNVVFQCWADCHVEEFCLFSRGQNQASSHRSASTGLQQELCECLNQCRAMRGKANCMHDFEFSGSHNKRSKKKNK